MRRLWIIQKRLWPVLFYSFFLTQTALAQQESIRWQPVDSKGLVENVRGHKTVHMTSTAWEGEVTNPFSHEQSIDLFPVRINADQERYFYVEYQAATAKALGVWFSGAEQQAGSGYFVTRLPETDDIAIMQFDLRRFAAWHGQLAKISVHFPGVQVGDMIRIHRIGTSREPVDRAEAGRLYKTVADDRRGDRIRMAAFHDTHVALDQDKGRAAVFTYIHGKASGYDLYMLLKILTLIDKEGRLIGSEQAQNLQVEDFPGGVRASYDLAGTHVTCEIISLLYGRDTSKQDGAALFKISTAPAVPIVLRCGGGDRFYTISGEIRPWFHEYFNSTDSIRLEKNLAIVHSEKQPHVLAVASSGRMARDMEEGGRCLNIRMEQGRGYVVMTYGPSAADAMNLAKSIEEAKAAQAVHAYYKSLLSSRIVTPEKVLDEAFTSAIYNLEYNYLQPYGWMEAINHWESLYHQQHSAAADWLGQEDRSKWCIQVAADSMSREGAIRCFKADGQPYIAFGGSNHFWAWQVRHYFNHTHDLDFARRIAPALDKVIAQTFAEYDAEGDLLLSWRAQIGNQEDFLFHPHNSTTPSIEGINMLATRELLANALGDHETAALCRNKITRAMAQLRQELWLPDLGRFAYFKDPQGVLRLDAQYQSYIYPLLYDVLDARDAWSSMRHLRDRLIGQSGEVYCSNNFSNHYDACTWGPQAAVAQQPWGALGLSALGLNNEAYKPLMVSAKWAMDPPHLGSWPEIAQEGGASYFTTPAALYVQAAIEALFGLSAHRPESYVRISPAFPDAWPTALLHLPQYKVQYKRDGNHVTYILDTDQPIARRVRWLLPNRSVERLLVNGKEEKFQLQPAVGALLLSLDIPAQKRTELSLTTRPLTCSAAFPQSIAEGDTLILRLQNCRAVEVDDRYGVLHDVKFDKASTLRGVVRTGLLSPYAGYGRLGLMNFSRRSFFVRLQLQDGLSFWQPIDIAILPAFEAAQKGRLDNDRLSVVVRNNSNSAYQGKINLARGNSLASMDGWIAPHTEKDMTWTLPADMMSGLSPGDNQFDLVLPGKTRYGLVASVEKARANQLHIKLPETACIADDRWQSVRTFYHLHEYLMRSVQSLLAPWADSLMYAKEVPVAFAHPGRKFVPVSWKAGRQNFDLSLPAHSYKKLYLLVIPFLDNHDTFAPVARVILTRKDGRLISKTLYTPGDLDFFTPPEAVYVFATARRPRLERLGLLPLLPMDQGDWLEGKPASCGKDSNLPNGFPQTEFWARSRTVQAATVVMNVIEIDLPMAQELQKMTLSSIGTEPAFGLVAVTAEIAP